MRNVDTGAEREEKEEEAEEQREEEAGAVGPRVRNAGAGFGVPRGWTMCWRINMRPRPICGLATIKMWQAIIFTWFCLVSLNIISLRS